MHILVPPADRCNPSPCGQNARCNDGICTCIPEYFGDPYAGCRPECVINTDCPRDKACVFHKCRDPCVGTCGVSAECNVVNHLPMCSCPRNMTGNAFIFCTALQGLYASNSSVAMIALNIFPGNVSVRKLLLHRYNHCGATVQSVPVRPEQSLSRVKRSGDLRVYCRIQGSPAVL